MKNFLLLLALAMNVNADVVSNGPDGFEINIERMAAAWVRCR